MMKYLILLNFEHMCSILSLIVAQNKVIEAINDDDDNKN